MINRRLTSAEAAERLGVKPATLYAYVSRGVLSRLRTPTGSTFDPQEVARLARSSRHRSSDSGPRSTEPPRAGGAGRAEGGDPVFVTELTLIADGRLFYRGLDAVELSRTRCFEAVAGWLWSGQWTTEGTPWQTPGAAAAAVSAALRAVGARSLPVEKFMVAVA